MKSADSKRYVVLAALENVQTTPFRYRRTYCKDVRNSEGQPSLGPADIY